MRVTKLSELRDVTVGVWGAGREGRSVARRLSEQGCRLVVIVDDVDDDARALAGDYGTSVVTPTEVMSMGVDFVVRSPGVSKYRDEIEQWEGAGVSSSGVFALWLADQDPNRVIGVTGTKGKSTTATLIAAVLRGAGHEVQVAGNIGVPVTEVRDAGYVVVEVSSYQASDCTTSPAIAVLTALGEDHITWHGSVERYHADKLRLFAGADLRAAVCDPSSGLAERLATIAAFPVCTGPWHVVGEDLVAGAQRVDASSVTAQVRRNLAVAANAATLVDASVDAGHLAHAVENFEPLPSRQREIAVVGGVRWVDDLLASNPTGVAAALESFASSPLILLMGGAGRGIDLGPLVAALSSAKNLKAVVLMGTDDDPLVKALAVTSLPVVRIDGHDMAAAVTEAARRSDPGDVVSFSPGAPTPALLGTWQDRSREFERLVFQLGD